jgi:hypothetical protein
VPGLGLGVAWVDVLGFLVVLGTHSYLDAMQGFGELAQQITLAVAI